MISPLNSSTEHLESPNEQKQQISIKYSTNNKNQNINTEILNKELYDIEYEDQYETNKYLYKKNQKTNKEYLNKYKTNLMTVQIENKSNRNCNEIYSENSPTSSLGIEEHKSYSEEQTNIINQSNRKNTKQDNSMRKNTDGNDENYSKKYSKKENKLYCSTQEINSNNFTNENKYEIINKNILEPGLIKNPPLNYNLKNYNKQKNKSETFLNKIDNSSNYINKEITESQIEINKPNTNKNITVMEYNDTIYNFNDQIKISKEKLHNKSNEISEEKNSNQINNRTQEDFKNSNNLQIVENDNNEIKLHNKSNEISEGKNSNQINNRITQEDFKNSEIDYDNKLKFNESSSNCQNNTNSTQSNQTYNRIMQEDFKNSETDYDNKLENNELSTSKNKILTEEDIIDLKFRNWFPNEIKQYNIDNDFTTNDIIKYIPDYILSTNDIPTKCKNIIKINSVSEKYLNKIGDNFKKDIKRNDNIKKKNINKKSILLKNKQECNKNIKNTEITNSKIIKKEKESNNKRKHIQIKEKNDEYFKVIEKSENQFEKQFIKPYPNSPRNNDETYISTSENDCIEIPLNENKSIRNGCDELKNKYIPQKPNVNKCKEVDQTRNNQMIVEENVIHFHKPNVENNPHTHYLHSGKINDEIGATCKEYSIAYKTGYSNDEQLEYNREATSFDNLKELPCSYGCNHNHRKIPQAYDEYEINQLNKKQHESELNLSNINSESKHTQQFQNENKHTDCQYCLEIDNTNLSYRTKDCEMSLNNNKVNGGFDETVLKDKVQETTKISERNSDLESISREYANQDNHYNSSMGAMDELFTNKYKNHDKISSSRNHFQNTAEQFRNIENQRSYTSRTDRENCYQNDKEYGFKTERTNTQHKNRRESSELGNRRNVDQNNYQVKRNSLENLRNYSQNKSYKHFSQSFSEEILLNKDDFHLRKLESYREETHNKQDLNEKPYSGNHIENNKKCCCSQRHDNECSRIENNSEVFDGHGEKFDDIYNKDIGKYFETMYNFEQDEKILNHILNTNNTCHSNSLIMNDDHPVKDVNSTTYNEIVDILKVIENEEKDLKINGNSNESNCNLKNIPNTTRAFNGSINSTRQNGNESNSSQARGGNTKLKDITETIKIDGDISNDVQVGVGDIYNFLDKVDNQVVSQVSINKRVGQSKLSDLMQLSSADLAQKYLSLSITMNEKQIIIEALEKRIEQIDKHCKDMKSDTDATVKRLQKFIANLIREKKALGDQCSEMCTDMEKKYKQIIETMEERHKIEIKRNTDKHLAAEKIRREKWIDNKTQKIKELTVKGLEPELLRMTTAHQEEISELRKAHNRQLEENDAMWNRKINTMKEKFEQDIQAAILQEKENNRKRLDEELKTMETNYQEQRKHLLNEIKTERENLDKQAENMRNEKEKEINQKLENIIKQNEQTCENLQKKHQNMIEKLKHELEEEKQLWIQNKTALMEEKEQLIREQSKRERDKHIEIIIQKLEKEQYDRTNAAELKIKHMKEQHDKDIEELETTVQNIKGKLNETRKKLQDSEDMVTELKSQVHTHQIESKNQSEQLNKLRQDHHELKVKYEHGTNDKISRLEEEIEQTRSYFETLISRMRKDQERELGQVYERVKQTISKKDETIQILTEQKQAALTQCANLEDMIQRKIKI